MLPDALTVGVPYELFWHLNPKKLHPFFKAFENKRRMRDEENWIWWGTYGVSAFSVVIANALGKNSKAKYLEKPFYEQLSESKKELTEEEKREKTEQLFAQLKLMETNFNLKHKGDIE